MKLLGRARLLVVAGLVNLLLIAALFWSRNGQTTTVTIQVVGDSYRTFIDGQLRAEARFTAGQRGGVLLAVEKNDSGVPTLPGPRGVDWVEVTDGHSGEVLFREDFDYFDGDIWRILSGEVAVHKGLVTAPVKTQIFLEDQGWNDFTLRVSYRNVASAQIGVKAKDSRNAVVYSFRPYRHYDNGLALLEDGVVVQSKPGSPIRAARAEVLKSITAMAVAPYPVIVVLVTAGILVTVVLQSLLQLLPLRSFLAALRRRRFSANSIALGIALAIAIDVFGLALYLNGTYNSFQPHVPDEVSYISRLGSSHRAI